MAKDVKQTELLKWDMFVGKSHSEALQEIYGHATNFSKKIRDWYWESVKVKKYSSLSIRTIIFILLLCGATLPILAGLSDDVDTRLKFTQFGVAALALAGLLQIADRIFGLSSGWLRYVNTVMIMEDLSRKFELDWANYMITKTDGISENDIKPLFDIAKKFEDDLYNKQKEETDKWIIEFNESTALLSELIKSQREVAEKTTADEKEKKKAAKPGAIELTINHLKNPEPIKIKIDNGEYEIFTGTKWSRIGVLPGLHEVYVTTTTEKSLTQKLPIVVQSGGITKTEVNLP